MKKSIPIIIILTVLIAFGIIADNELYYSGSSLSTEEKIVESVVIVNGSSGTVIKSTEHTALILTSYHIIKDYCKAVNLCLFNNMYVHTIEYKIGDDDSVNVVMERYPVLRIAISPNDDLAILEVFTKSQLHSSETNLSEENIRYGSPIYSASNPQFLYRSLKKGIISSPFRIVDGTVVFEIDSGVISGSSGGGIFNMDGELIGVMNSLRMFTMDNCTKDGNCLHVPLPFIGFANHPVIIENFIQKSIFCSDLGYKCLNEEKESNGK